MESKRKRDNGVNSSEDDISQSSSTSASTVDDFSQSSSMSASTEDDISQSSSTSASTDSLAPAAKRMKKVQDATHFESKLLELFCIRTPGSGYTFELTKEREENFSENDQIDWLANYWMEKLQLSEDNKKVIEEFAKLLVTRMSETLKDKERAFIGIPLQCKILAECYITNIEEIVRNNTGNDVIVQSEDVVSQQLLNLLDNQKFDLVSLYSRLMDTKRKIFREEKTNSFTWNQIMADAMDSWTKKIESRLTKLAFETIFIDQNILQLFWPLKSSLKSTEDNALKENTLAENILRYGLTFSVGDGMKNQQFWHRTFAEYLVAKYLYEGFILDDRHHNKLLENEAIRQLIVNKIFAEKQYNGVQVFFDSMVKNLIDENEFSTIDGLNLSDRLKEFAKSLFTQLLRQNPKYFVIGNREIENSFTANALNFSLSKGKCNIFKLLFECLDSTFEKQQVRWAMFTSFIAKRRPFSLKSLPESKLFKRFIDYFDIDPDSPIMDQVVEEIITGLFPLNDFPYGSANPSWNRDEHQQIMTHLIDFLANQRVAFNKYCKFYKRYDIEPMLKFLVCHDNYRNHLEIFLKLLSQLEYYSNDEFFAKLLMRIFESEELMSGQITKTLDILNGLGRHSLLVYLYGEVLTIDPEAFQNIYQLVLEKEDSVLNDMDNLLKMDSYNMTPLHAAAFHGDVEIVNQIFATIRQGGLDPDHETELRRMVFEEFTPFYFAAARGHEKICCTILAFVKDIFPGELELTEGDTVIHLSLFYAMESYNVEMYQLILKVVKKELGHDYLIDLLKAKSDLRCWSSTEMWNVMAEIIVDRNGIVDYKYLDDFVFNKGQDLSEVIEEVDVEHVQGLLLLNGAATFTKCILHMKNSPSEGFTMLSRHFLPHLSKEQLLDFVEVITRNDSIVITSDDDDSVVMLDDETSSVQSERIVKRCSFWDQLLRSMSPFGQRDVVDEDSIIVCLTFVSDILGGDYAKQLLLHQDDDGYIIIRLSQDSIKRMLNCLPQKSQEEIKQEWEDKLPLMTPDSFITLDSTNSWDSNITKHNVNVLRFYLDYGSDVQLKKCVNILTFVRFIDGQQYSVWSNIVENSGMEETIKLLESISKILGREALSELLLHVKEVPLHMRKLLPDRCRSIRDDIYGKANSRLVEGLPQEIRDYIQEAVELQAAQWIEKFLSHQVYIAYSQFLDYINFDTFEFFQYCSNKKQRKKFVKNITTLKTYDENLNIWAYMLLIKRWDKGDITKMDTFMKSVMEKLGLDAVKDLVLHKEDDIPVIFYVALKGDEKLLETMLTHLDAKSRKKIQRQVNEVLDKTFQIPSNGEVTDAMMKGLDFDA